MKTIATIATNLFIFLFLAVSMPVQAGWETFIEIDKMTDEERIFFFITDNSKNVALIYGCDNEDTFALMKRGSFGKEYENKSLDNELLIRFDKKPAYVIENVFFSDDGGFLIEDNDFLLKVKKHQTLLAKIQVLSDDYITVEFDISGFNEAVENYCQ